MEVIIHQENINEHKLFVFSSYCPKSDIFHPKLDETIQNVVAIHRLTSFKWIPNLLGFFDLKFRQDYFLIFVFYIEFALHYLSLV